MSDVVRIIDMGGGYYQATWYYGKRNVQMIHIFPKGGVYETLRNVEILVTRGYPVEPPELLEKLRLFQASPPETESRG